MNGLLDDLRDAARGCRRAPVRTLTIVAVIAIGVGATTALAAMARALLWAPLPFPNSEQLVRIESVQTDTGRTGQVSYLDFEDWRAGTRTMSLMAAAGLIRFVFTSGEAESVVGEYVSEDYFAIFGVQPLLGRLFTPADFDRGGTDVVVLRETVWRRRFSANPSLIGSVVMTADGPFTVIGVVGRSFGGLSDQTCLRCTDVEFWVPAPSSRHEYPGFLTDRGRRWHDVVARLRPGVRPTEAHADVAALARALEVAFGATNRHRSARVTPLADGWRHGVRPLIAVLFGATCTVLLIACVNVAMLIMTRHRARAAEFALRGALGAGRTRLMRHMLVESVALSMLGGGIGVAVALSMSASLVRASGIALPEFITVPIDTTTLAIATVMCLLTGVAFGLPPAWRSARTEYTSILRQLYGGGLSTPGRAGRWAVRAQVALVFTLLVVGGLLARSHAALTAADPGFNPDNVLVFEVNPNHPRWDSTESLRVFLDQLAMQLGALPAGDRITMAAPHMPPRTFARSDISLGPPGSGADLIEGVDTHRVLAGFFEFLGIEIKAGRPFTAADRAGAQSVATVSASLARRLWPGLPAVGRQLFIAGRSTPVVVVAVVRDVKYGGLRSPRRSDWDLYLPLAQAPLRYVTIAARTKGDEVSVARSIRQTLHQIAPDLPVLESSSIAARLHEQRSDMRLQSLAFAGLGAAALVLAVAGMYGVVSGHVRFRWRELAIRLMLGESHGDVVRRLLVESGALIGSGLMVGMVLAAVSARALTARLFAVHPYDPLTVACASAVVIGSASAAAYVAIRRVFRLDPAEILRSRY